MKKIYKLFAIVFFITLSIYTIYISFTINNNDYNYSILNQNEKFKLKKIIAYSSANAINTANIQYPYWNLSIYQFTDFAIYIDTVKDGEIKEISIENLKVDNMPEYGETRFL